MNTNEQELRLKWLEAKWKRIREEFLHVKAGPSLANDFLNMKRLVFGDCLVSQDKQVINIDAT